MQASPHGLRQGEPHRVVVRVADAVVLRDIGGNGSAGIDRAVGCEGCEGTGAGGRARVSIQLVGIGADQQVMAGRSVVTDGAYHAPRQRLRDVRVKVFTVGFAQLRVDIAESESRG